MRLALTTNSPGEVSAWVRPFMKALMEKQPKAEVTVFVVPCTFASGAELEVVQAIPGVKALVSPREFFRFMLSPAGAKHGFDGVVFLGGDLMWAAWLGRKFRCPVVAYTEGQAHLQSRFARFFVPDERARGELLRRGVPTEKIVTVGNLMLDAVTPRFTADKVRKALGLIEDRPVLALFPGSRPKEVCLTVPFFLRVAELVAERLKGLQVIMSVSPFVSAAQLGDALESAGVGREGEERENTTGGVLSQTGCCAIPGVESLLLVTDSGLQVKGFRGVQYDVMMSADVALTIPGSNTLEMAHLHLPMLVAVPLHRPEDVPLEGLPGLVGRLPFLGKYIKRVAVRKFSAKLKYTALPNRMADREIVPEMRGRLKAREVAEKLRRLLQDDAERERISRELKEFAQPGGAAERMVDEVLKVFKIEERK